MSEELDKAINKYEELVDGEHRTQVEAARSQLEELRIRIDDAQSEVAAAVSGFNESEAELLDLEAKLAADISQARARVDAALALEREPSDSGSVSP